MDGWVVFDSRHIWRLLKTPHTHTHAQESNTAAID